MSPLIYILLTLCHLLSINARSYTWNVGWVNRNPDTLHSRPVIGINGRWPPPTLHANVGERLTININNQLGNETTSLHFHGLFQNGTNSMDGPVGVVQCPIGPGESFTHTFTVGQPGTYWYHSHAAGQYPDGFRGPMIVHDPSNPYAGKIDDELVLTLSDWYHTEMPNLIPGFLDIKANPEGNEPVPDSAILNDNLTTSLNVSPGKTYMTRIINMSTFASFFVTFDQHDMTVIEVDGVYTQAAQTSLIYLTAGQRMSVLITAKQTKSHNYAFVGAMDPGMFASTIPVPGPNLNATGYLIYDSTKPLPKSPPTFPSYETGFLDDFSLIPYDKQPLFQNVNKRITLNIKPGNGAGAPYYGQNRFSINSASYVQPKVPTLFSVLSTGSSATNPVIYGPPASNPFVIRHMDIVEVVVNNYDTGGHPIHMHGHNFQMVARSAEGAAPFKGPLSNPPSTPIRRDVLKINTGGYLVYRFVADNPDKSPLLPSFFPRGPSHSQSFYSLPPHLSFPLSQPLSQPQPTYQPRTQLTPAARVWFIHCHIDWHLIGGFAATVIEAPLALQSQRVPQGQIHACKSQGLPYQGNAAGNTKNYTDLTGANEVPPGIYDQSALINPHHYT